MELDDRKKKVLLAIIRDYISTAEPVGSRTISKKYEIGVSPATIRNEMADLEETGLIEQPHASAGRIPSDLGYRYYVDRLMQKEELTDRERKIIREKIKSASLELDNVLRCTSQLISELTKYTSMILVQSVKDEALIKYIQLVSMSQKLVMIVMVLDTGAVYHRIIEMPETIKQEELNCISSILNSKLAKLNLEHIRSTVIKEVYTEISKYKLFLDFILEAFRQDKSSSNETYKVYMGGIYNILSQPEFHDINRVKKILELIEREELLLEVLRLDDSEGLSIRIGIENPQEHMKECSIITATYYIGNKAIGSIGVLGPTRMEYAKVVAVVEYLSEVLNMAFSKLK